MSQPGTVEVMLFYKIVLTLRLACHSGGSAKQARNRRFQAILPLRGKILNAERKDDAALYKNTEISNMIIALGLGVKGEEELPLRYGKVTMLACLTVPHANRVGNREDSGFG